MENTSVVAPVSERLLPRVSWGAIFAGTFVSLATWFVLYMLGMGIGLATIDPDSPRSLEGILLGTSVWGLIAPIIGLFMGGMVVGRMVGPLSRPTGAVYGVIVWSVSAVIALGLIWSTATSVVGGATRVAGGVVSSMGNLGSATAGMAGNLSIDTQDLVGPINQRLVAAGKPTVTADQLQNALGTAVRRSVRNGSVERETLVTAVAQETALTRADAEQIAAQMETRVRSALASLGAAGNRAGEMALQALDTTGKGLIWLVISMIVALLASCAGATIIVGHEQKRATRSAELPAAH